MTIEALPGLEIREPKRIKNGPMLTATKTVVDRIQADTVLSSRYAALCALALVMGEDVDNIDYTEKAYARTKLYDAAAKVCQALAEAMTESGGGDILTATLEAIRAADTIAADAEGDDL